MAENLIGWGASSTYNAEQITVCAYVKAGQRKR